MLGEHGNRINTLSVLLAVTRTGLQLGSSRPAFWGGSFGGSGGSGDDDDDGRGAGDGGDGNGGGGSV